MSREEKINLRRRKTWDAIVNFVVGYFQEHGYAPSFEEIGQGIGLKSRSSVHGHIKRMLEEGVLESDASDGTPRAIRVPGYRFTFGQGEL